MRFDLLLQSGNPRPVLPYDYHSILHKTIRSVLGSADSRYLTFMRSKGIAQPKSLRNFSLFTFSNLTTAPLTRKEPRLYDTQGIHLVVALHLPKTAEKFIEKLFLHQEIKITDQNHIISLIVERVQSWPFLPGSCTKDHKKTGLMIQPLSPMVVGKKNSEGKYDFLSPDHPAFNYQLLSCWKERYRRVYPEENIEAVFNQVEIKYIPELRPFRSRPVTLQVDSKKTTTLNGYERFTLHVSAPVKALELAGNTGWGLYNNWGMGCIAARLR